MRSQAPAIISIPEGLIIGGAIIRAKTSMDVIDPATEETFAQAPDANIDELDLAVIAARKSYPDWRALDWSARAELLHAYADAVWKDVDNLSGLLVREQGKPLNKAHSEIASGLKFLRAFADMDLPVETIRDTPDNHIEIIRTPLGVVGAIVPWNYPVLLALWKIGPALITGNALVLKPAPTTPLTALRLGEIANDVLPPGVLNVVSGGDELGPWMTAHEGIAKISFTGSSATGRRVMASAAATLKRLTLELGGNDAAIILPDFDVGAHIEALFWSAFSNSGQVCVALKRLIVHESKMDEVCDGLSRIAETIIIGPGFDKDVRAGPIQNRAQYQKLRPLIENAEQYGTVIFKGPILDRKGFFLPITIVRDVERTCALWREEPFGPILPICAYRHLDEAIEIANDDEYGLGASVWGDDLAQAESVARRLDAGSVWTNTHPAMGPDIPLAGIKQSGFGVEFSRHGLAEYTDLRVINVKRGG